MSWEAPEGHTTLEGLTYRLEYRLQSERFSFSSTYSVLSDDGDPCAPWHTIHDDIDDESAVVKHLEPLGIYQFRVRNQERNRFKYGGLRFERRALSVTENPLSLVELYELIREVRVIDWRE